MTLGELKTRMSYAELQTWASYVERTGPLSSVLRTDAAIARAVVPFLKNARVADFMPWPKEVEEEATPEALLHMLKGLTKH